MTEHSVDMSFRIFWTKIARQWHNERLQQVRAQVLQVTQRPDFQKNMIERRYRVEGLDDQAHSGASLLALLDVLAALEAYKDETNDGR